MAYFFQRLKTWKHKTDTSMYGLDVNVFDKKELHTHTLIEYNDHVSV